MRARDRIVPLIAGLMIVLVAASVVLLLASAENQGTKALRTALLGQVRATANSFNARVGASLTSAASFGSVGWDLTKGSAKDNRILQTYNVNPNAKSGFYLVNGDGDITAGVLLKPGVLGSRFDSTQWPALKKRLASTPALVLPVEHSGMTTELPVYNFVIAVHGPNKTVRGAFVFEQALDSTSAFEQEIAQLGQHAASSAAWFFIDSRGSVLASSNDSSLGGPVEDKQYLTHSPGLSNIGGRVVAIADVPAVGWRVVFRENRAQFERALSGPLQTSGLIVVLLLLGIGGLLVVLLVRRLRAAREEERRLRELNRSQAEFVSVVSHELRTPVAGVLGFLQTTVDHWATMSDADRLSTVRRAVTNARRLQTMTRDVLDSESIESGRLGYSFQRVDLGAELETAVEASGNIDADHRVRLVVPAQQLMVAADADRLQQVFGNLLENARRNSPPSEPVDVNVEVVDGVEPQVRISIIDHGPGVDAESLERIFQKFARGSDNAVTGTGLGLYIVRTIVDAHGGRVWCESTPGTSTAFIVELPLATAAEPVTASIGGSR
ncbi:ATP-binding protein [uncultured Jatrophihabitans sp.]|uniref:sensor histidine kinase n=1 Tax=uncultured Jatrophihabitans sp. TaxID=1610747 RepID=UPI0035CBF7E2